MNLEEPPPQDESAAFFSHQKWCRRQEVLPPSPPDLPALNHRAYQSAEVLLRHHVAVWLGRARPLPSRKNPSPWSNLSPLLWNCAHAAAVPSRRLVAVGCCSPLRAPASPTHCVLSDNSRVCGLNTTTTRAGPTTSTCGSRRACGCTLAWQRQHLRLLPQGQRGCRRVLLLKLLCPLKLQLVLHLLQVVSNWTPPRRSSP